MSAYFSATETAFSALNKTRLKTLADKGDKKAARVLKLADNYDRLLSTVLVGNNIVNLTLSSVGTIFFVKLLKDNNVGAAVSTAVITVAVLIFGEISPKSIAMESPERFASFSAPIIRVFMVILTPICFLFSLWKKLLSKIVKVPEEKGMTSDELVTLIDTVVEEEGEIDSDEGEIIRSAVEFNDIEASDVLTPRVNIIGVETDEDKNKIAEIFTETGYSRLPVYKDSLDNIVGIIHQKDFYDGPKVTTKPLKKIMKEPVYVTPSMKIRDILRLLQKEKSHIAVVTDEYGGTLGIVTMEDILEEIVGEIWDEHDEVVEEFIKESDDAYKILGSADLEDMFELFDMEEDEETDSVSVSGWVMEQIGRMPVEGDTFRYKNLDVTVEKLDDRMVEEITVKILPPEEEEEEE